MKKKTEKKCIDSLTENNELNKNELIQIKGGKNEEKLATIGDDAQLA